MLKHIPFYGSLLGRELTPSVKATNSHVLVYGAIEAHAMGVKGCIASSQLIADETGLKLSTVRTVISTLATAGWINVTLDDKNHRVSIDPLMDIKAPFNSDNSPLQSPQNEKPKITDEKESLEYNENTVEITNNNTNVLLEHSSLLKPLPKKEFGDPDVNAVLKAFQEQVTKTKLTNISNQRRYASLLIKTHSLEVVLKVIEVYAAIQTEAFAPHIDSVEDLYHKWDKIMGFGRRRVANQDKNKAVDLSEL